MTEVEKHLDSQNTATDVTRSPSNSVAWILLGIPLVIAVFSFFYARWFGWSLGWLYVGNFALTHAFGWLCIRKWDPVVISRRKRLGNNTKRWEFAILIALLVGLGATIFVATNDVPENSRPGVSWLIRAFFFASGYGVTLWCSVVNPFLEKTVRIQADNQHRVIQTGPYAFVRHPMYVGLIAAC